MYVYTRMYVCTLLTGTKANRREAVAHLPRLHSHSRGAADPQLPRVVLAPADHPPSHQQGARVRISEGDRDGRAACGRADEIKEEGGLLG
jgi:hypothetical protein